MLFFPMLLISLFMSLIMNSWISLWMIMEINLLSIIMLMLFDKLIKFELLMKYFLFQSFNSYLYLMNSLFIYFFNNELFQIIMNFNMLMKLSIVPFHYWYIKIIMNLNWMNIFNLTILNKIIPLIIINNIMNYYNNNIMLINFILLILSSLFSCIMTLNMINIKLIMGYSSMIQISWIIISMNFNEIMSVLLFIIYMLISLNIYFNMYMMNVNNLIELNYLKFNNKLIFLNLMLSLFSLSSIPPFWGFMIKLISIKIFSMINLNYLFMFLMIFNSLVSMFFYIRLMYFSLVNYMFTMKNNMKFINFPINLNYKLIYLNWMTIMFFMIYEIF
uniref:NADH-ubiquinone oxidoreductase chain 2 n=1 Tax=Chouioia cunea TaxID=1570515 RepID=A0A8B0R793_9HYME|nr:NADH dehydrogenase subunit 2 [Chouioia cunea]QTW90610.1 NADH dehydrogenase subunit 2 [Chouioia cunea]